MPLIEFFQDWDRESTPLKPKGGEAKFIKGALEKFSGEEGENIFVQVYTAKRDLMGKCSLCKSIVAVLRHPHFYTGPRNLKQNGTKTTQFSAPIFHALSHFVAGV